MLVGHLGVGLIGKRVEPKISLGTWILAALLADFVCFPLMIAGVESFRHGAGNIPYSHSLLMLAIWAALFGVAFFALRRNRAGALLLACAVLSHWVLDAISHPPDMQLSPGVSKAFGLDLWNSVPATLIVEGGFWALAILIYVRTTRARYLAALFGFWIGIALFTLTWYGNIQRGIDPNPVRAGAGGLVFFSLIVAWAYWMNRARVSNS